MAERKDVFAMNESAPGSMGALTWWELRGHTTISSLAAAWELEGFAPEELMCEAPSTERALARATQHAMRERQIRRPLGRRGAWEVIDEEVVGDGDDQTLEHSALVRASVERFGGKASGAKSVRVTVANDSEEAAAMKECILELLSRYEQQLVQRDLSDWLLRLLSSPRFRALHLRQKGGFYFVPEDRVAAWEGVAKVVEVVGCGVVWTMPAARAERAVAAILAAVRLESERAFAEMEDYLIGDVSTRGLNSVERRLHEAREKLRVYANLLGSELPELTTRAAEVEGALAAAKLLEEEGDV